jgi:hypothetical protein
MSELGGKFLELFKPKLKFNKKVMKTLILTNLINIILIMMYQLKFAKIGNKNCYNDL